MYYAAVKGAFCMKAIIMAGGEGTRLRPLTCDTPKPMTRLCGRPVLEYILDLLKKNGVTEAAVTLGYLPGVIRDAFPDEEYQGMRLHFFEENEPLGTAGSVKNASSFLDDDFIVISGDCMCDFGLSAAMEYHRRKGAAATLLLSHVADPREYGLVVTEPTGRVQGFVEKPGWGQAVTDAINTGIYIVSPACLPLIPDGKMFDFAKDLFPLLMQRSMPVFGCDMDGYWCDIGDIGAFTSCQFDMLEGRVECRLPGARQSGMQLKDGRPAGGYRIIPPVYIGSGVQIGNDAIIGPNAVLDDRCSVGCGATIKNSVLLPDCYIGERSELRGALVCPGASLKRGAGMFEGTVAGAGAVVGRDASVSPGVRIWPGKRVEDGARAAVNLKFGTARRGIFDDDGISGEIGIEMTPETCARIGAAAAGAYANGKIGIAYSGGAAAASLLAAAGAGITSAGVQVCDFGCCLESMFRFAVGEFGLSLGFYIRAAGGRASIHLTDAAGLPVGRAVERKLDSAVSTGELRRCAAQEFRVPARMDGFRLLYSRRLEQEAGGRLEDIFAVVKSPNREAAALLSGVIRSLGCTDDPSGIHIHLNAAGTGVSFTDERGGYISEERALALCCLTAFESGSDVALPFDAPRIADSLAAQFGKKVLRYLECPADSSDRQARELTRSQPWVRDGLICAARLLGYIEKRKTTLFALSSRLPGFAVTVRAIPCKGNPGNILRMLSEAEKAEQQDGPAEGVLFASSGGKILLSPLRRGSGVRVMAEAANMEAAEELCSLYEDKLRSSYIEQK